MSLDDNWEGFLEGVTAIDADGNLLNPGADPTSLVEFVTVGITTGEQYVAPPSEKGAGLLKISTSSLFSEGAVSGILPVPSSAIEMDIHATKW